VTYSFRQMSKYRSRYRSPCSVPSEATLSAGWDQCNKAAICAPLDAFAVTVRMRFLDSGDSVAESRNAFRVTASMKAQLPGAM
jgi:hypothetical protein